MDELEAINPDVIITNTLVIPWGALTALSLNKPHAWYVREFGQLDHGLKFFLPFEEVIKIIGTSNIVLSISNAVRTALFKDALSPSITIYNYINIPADALDKDTVQYFVKKNATRLIITGNISEPKGQKDAVLAVKRLIEKGKDVELVIMGISQPDYLDEVKELIKIYELENHIKCLDFNPNPYPIVSQSDIVLVCSRSEAFGRVIVEGMLIKKPVIGTKSGGIPELIKDGINGLLYEPGKPEQLAEKIEYLIDNVDKKNEIAENGFNYAQRTFTKENYGGEAFKQLFNLKNNGNRSPPILLSLLVSLMSRALNAKDVENKAIILEKEKLEQTIVKNVEIINQLENIIQQKEATILQKEASVQRLRDELSLIKGSIIWRTVTRYQSIVDLFMPHRTLRRKFYDTWLKAMSIVVSNNPASLYLKIQQRIAPKKYSYEQWIRENEPSKEELAAQKVQSKKFMMRPLISIIVPVYNTPPDVLEKMLKSVIDQTYGNWELCIAVGGSKDNNIRNILSGVDDPRVKTKFLDKNLGISGNTNEALTLAIGEFISFLDHDDELASFALYEVVRAINEKPDLDIIYSDEDKIDMENNRSSPFFKPDWSLPMFLSTNYMCHFLVCRRSLVDKLEKFRSEFDGAQDYDFALRLIELTTGNRIGHIQKVLYHWRIISSSAASGQHAKPYAYDAGKKALNEYMERNHIDCEAITDQVNWGSYHVIKRSVTHKKLVMVLVGNNSRMSDCLSTILQDTISSQNNGPVAIYAPKSLKMSGYRTYDSLNESIETILGEIGPEYFVFIKDTITTGDIQESHDHKWPCALLEQFDRFRDVGIVGTGSAVYSNVICSAHRPCGPVFCMPSSLLLSYIRGNRLPDDYDTLQIALSDYAELYGHENIYTPYSIGKLNDLSIVPKYYLELFDKRYFTNNMRYYLKGIL
jgi:glycosyltransferase involved in cell wall biosynthesis